MSKKEIVDKILNTLDEYGETFFTLGSTKVNYDYLTGVIERQGYWAGVRYRIYFDGDYNLTEVERR